TADAGTDRGPQREQSRDRSGGDRPPRTDQPQPCGRHDPSTLWFTRFPSRRGPYRQVPAAFGDTSSIPRWTWGTPGRAPPRRGRPPGRGSRNDGYRCASVDVAEQRPSVSHERVSRIVVGHVLGYTDEQRYQQGCRCRLTSLSRAFSQGKLSRQDHLLLRGEFVLRREPPNHGRYVVERRRVGERQRVLRGVARLVGGAH